MRLTTITDENKSLGTSVKRNRRVLTAARIYARAMPGKWHENGPTGRW